MSRIYTVPYSGTVTALGGDCDLFDLQPVANKPIRLRGLRIGQTTDHGDAQETVIRISIIRLPATVTSGSGGSAVTPVAVDENDAAAGFTARCNDATIATTTGTAETREELSWNVRNVPTEFWWPDDKYAPRVQNAAALIVRNQTTLGADTVFQMTAWVEEY